ncbi:MAG: adenine deaminase C-terminal domain-containing protein [Pseudomonadota bacterium]
MITKQKIKLLSEVALGALAPDAVITNGTLFNVFTREFIKGQSIWIKDGMIAYVGPNYDSLKDHKTRVIDADGMVLLPGLIEGHTHIVTRSGIEEFVKYVIPTGVTTVITETIELATVVGKDGFEYLVRGLEGQPIRFYYTVSPLCGLILSEEINAPSPEELMPLLTNSKCLGVGEVYWGNLFLEGDQGARVRELVSRALALGKRVEGHTAGAKGKRLQAYTCFGVSSCHEPITEEEVMERLRIGYWVMVREGAIRKELSAIQNIFKKDIDFRRLILTTDSMDPEGLMSEGFLDASLKMALKLGAPPEVAYQMVTINVAEHFHLDHLIGSLSPGKMADIVLIPSPEAFSPQLVMCAGEVIFRDGRTMVEPRRVTFPDYMYTTVKVQGYHFPLLPKKGNVRVIELVTRLVTQERIVDLGDPEESRDVIMMLALNRLGSGEAFMGFLKGFGLQKGACGSTMCWDSVDMILVGCDTQSMETVIGRLREIGGGAVYAIGDEVVAEFPAPLCGVISLQPMEIIRDDIKRLEEAMREHGVRWENPILTLDVLGTAAIPHIRITHEGYVRLKDRKILSLEP